MQRELRHHQHVVLFFSTIVRSDTRAITKTIDTMMFLLVGGIPTGNCKPKRGCLESLAIGTSNVGGQPIAGESRQPPAAFHPRISERNGR